MPDWKHRTLNKTSIFQPTPPTPLELFVRNPILFLVTWLYNNRPTLLPYPISQAQPTRVVCISDTHNERPSIPDGDILIHAGDLTQNGTFAELQAQLDWLRKLPHKHKIVVAGNHDLLLDEGFVTRVSARFYKMEVGRTKNDLEWGDIVYLEDAAITVLVRGREVRGRMSGGTGGSLAKRIL
ncbi:hypothetical protein N0V90_009718 [Kalmusia sp. IMI 367209]|nr:hypothetical protein N0V90_009718 [Kalmusia sp. IMI 367209]